MLGGGVLGLLAFAGSRTTTRVSPALVLCAGAAIAICQLTFFEAVHRAEVAVGAVVAIGSGPVAAGVLERSFGDTWPGARWLAATALAVAGIVTLSLGGTGHAAASTSGILLALVSGTAYATYTVIAKRLLHAGAGPVRVMGAAFGVGSLLLLPVLLIGNTYWLHSTRGIELAAYLAVGRRSSRICSEAKTLTRASVVDAPPHCARGVSSRAVMFVGAVRAGHDEQRGEALGCGGQVSRR